MAIRPFPVNPEMTAIAIAYRNPDFVFIADDVLPVVPTHAEFKYLKYDLAQGFSIPDSRVGRKSAPNQVSFSSTEIIDKVVDWGLDDIVPNDDIDADNQGINPVEQAVTYLANLVKMGREQRAASLVFNASSYAAANQATLSGTSQWSDAVNSDPIAAIGDALDVPVMKPNVAVFGQPTWTKLSRHPKVVQAVRNTAQQSGVVSPAGFAEIFNLQQVYVGSAFGNQAKMGQPASMARLWGKHAAFLYRDRTAGPMRGVTFGFTAQFGTWISGMIDQPTLGLKGCQLVRCGNQMKEVVCASDLGYFFQNAVA